MKKLFIILFGLVIFAGLSSAATCYQETANVSTACGGLSTGTYAFNVVPGHVAWTDQQNIYDGNWGTFGISSTPGSGSDMVINYTKPSGAYGAVIQLKTQTEIINITIPDSCFDYSPTNLSIYIGSGASGALNCLNSSGYGSLATSGNQIYEEGIYWQMVNDTTPKISTCDSTYPYPFVNFTFKDEDTSASLNSSMDGTTINDGTNVFTYSNDTELKSIAFCSYAINITINATFYAPYTSGTYPQRIYQNNLRLTNITTNVTLYLLGASSGQYVTFQLINAAEQPLEDVLVVINKTISGTQTQISSGFTGADGGITFWLNPDDQYTLGAYLSPYPSYTTTQAFTQDSYTITLGSAGETNASDYNRGITYSLVPTDEWLSNGTTYSFNFTLSSSYWALDSWGFNITNGSHTWLGNVTNLTSTGGVSRLSLNTGSNSTLILTYFWVVGNATTQAIRIYRVLDFSHNDYSITRLISDFTGYVDSADGLFGLTDFGVGIIIFFVIVGTVGAAKMKFGLSDEATLTGLLFALVVLFDYGFGLLPNPVNAVPHFPSTLIGIVFIGFAFKEVFQ